MSATELISCDRVVEYTVAGEANHVNRYTRRILSAARTFAELRRELRRLDPDLPGYFCIFVRDGAGELSSELCYAHIPIPDHGPRPVAAGLPTLFIQIYVYVRQFVVTMLWGTIKYI